MNGCFYVLGAQAPNHAKMNILQSFLRQGRPILISHQSVSKYMLHNFWILRKFSDNIKILIAITIVMLWVYYTLKLFRLDVGYPFQLSPILHLAKNHWWGWFISRNMHLVHTVNSIKFWNGVSILEAYVCITNESRTDDPNVRSRDYFDTSKWNK